MVLAFRKGHDGENQPIPLWGAIVIGAAANFFSGLTGVGWVLNPMIRAVSMPSGLRRVGTRPSIRNSAGLKTFGVFSPPVAIMGLRSPLTLRCNASPIILGSPSMGNGSSAGPTARSSRFGKIPDNGQGLEATRQHQGLYRPAQPAQTRQSGPAASLKVHR